MADGLRDAIDVRVIAHMAGVDEVERSVRNIKLQIAALDSALAKLIVELEVD